MPIRGKLTDYAARQLLDGCDWIKDGEITFDAFRLDFEPKDLEVKVTMTLILKGVDVFTFESWLASNQDSFLFHGHFPMQMTIDV